MDTPVKTTLQSVMSDPAVDTTLTMVATMVKLSRDAVTTIVASGLPFMATVADTDPVVQVLAATMPAVVYAVGRANTRVNEVGFGRQLRNLQA
jgi:hypothetical protein